MDICSWNNRSVKKKSLYYFFFQYHGTSIAGTAVRCEIHSLLNQKVTQTKPTHLATIMFFRQVFNLKEKKSEQKENSEVLV